MAFLDDDLFLQLQAAGYTGNNTFEDLIASVTDYLIAHNIAHKLDNGMGWWVEVKDAAILKNKRFQELAVKKWIQYLGT